MDKEELDNTIQKEKEVVLYSYQQAKNYATVIMMGGYAGLFAIWNFTKSDLARWESMLIALLILFSVCIFVLYDLCGIYLNATLLPKLLKKLQEAERLNSFPAEYAKHELKNTERFVKMWPFFFFPSSGAAVIASILLARAFVAKLICS